MSWKSRLALIKDEYQVVVTPVLIWEVLANRFQRAKDQVIVGRMREVILGFYPHWIELPLELVFKELVLQETIGPCVGLSPNKADRLYQALLNPLSVSPDLREWMPRWYEGKRALSNDRKELQEKLKRVAPPELLYLPNLAMFVDSGVRFLGWLPGLFQEKLPLRLS